MRSLRSKPMFHIFTYLTLLVLLIGMSPSLTRAGWIVTQSA